MNNQVRIYWVSILSSMNAVSCRSSQYWCLHVHVHWCLYFVVHFRCCCSILEILVLIWLSHIILYLFKEGCILCYRICLRFSATMILVPFRSITVYGSSSNFAVNLFPFLCLRITLSPTFSLDNWYFFFHLHSLFLLFSLWHRSFALASLCLFNTLAFGFNIGNVPCTGR